MKKYKVLKKGLVSPRQKYKYEINKNYVCDNFNADVKKSCAPGFYAVDVEGLPCAYKYGYDIWLCEVGGRSVILDQYKQRFEKIKLIKKVGLFDIRKEALSQEEKLGYKLSEMIFPVHPFFQYPEKVTQKEIDLLNAWVLVNDLVKVPRQDSVQASVWDSVDDSVWASVWDSVYDSVWDSVGYSVWDLIGDSIYDSVGRLAWDSTWYSVEDSVGAYISSFFPNITKWKYVNHREGENPFQPGIDLWKAGFIPIYYSGKWRLVYKNNGQIKQYTREQ